MLLLFEPEQRALTVRGDAALARLHSGRDRMPFDLGYLPHQAERARTGAKGFSLQSFYSMFPDEEACLRHVLRSRLGPTMPCNRCGRPGSWSRIRGTTCFRHTCNAVRSPLTGTVFHMTKLPVHLWLYAMLHFANSHGSVSISFLERHLGLGLRASVRMADQIRLHLAALDHDLRIGSASSDAVVRLLPLSRVIAPSQRPNQAQVLVVGDARHAVGLVVPHPRRHRIRKILANRVYLGARLITDCHRTYRVLAGYGHLKPLAAFSPFCFDRDRGECDTILGLMTSIRYGRMSQHMNFYEQNLWKYLKEYEFRYNRRHQSDRVFPDMVAKFPKLTPSAINALRSSNCIDPPQVARA